MAIAESRYLGGACVNAGCVPHKLFVFAAQFREQFEQAKRYGWNSDAGETIQGIAVAMKAGTTKETFDSTIGIHPTVAETFVNMREPVRR